MKRLNAIDQIILNQDITTWYQPMVNLDEGKVFGWEALTRGPSISTLHSAEALFGAAVKEKKLKPLELICVNNATKCFEQLLLSGKLFVNISHELLLAGNTLRKQLKDLISKGPVSPNKIVLELTERGFTGNIDKLMEAVVFFHQLGFQIAIDDLGTGNISVDQWMSFRPDYVKIDRHFITGVHSDTEKQNFVRSIVASARAYRSKVIAEGVETQQELNTLRSLGVTLCQGYFFQRPELSPLYPDLKKLLVNASDSVNEHKLLACDLTMTQDSVVADTALEDIVALFENNIALESVAVMEHNEVIGLVQRERFLWQAKLSKTQEFVVQETVSDFMGKNFLQFDSHMSLSQVSRAITARSRKHVYDDFVVNFEGKFLGIGYVIDVYRKINSVMFSIGHPVNSSVNKQLERECV
ncbi:MAG: EAL domain-containing protein (putative c-di-GMP-specific phosphodiesterase class I) [Oleiphilaceae bacterium]|jgi:EAL domain-containing protein (putative c-di-GMP-specific phosphodiesterase class I)